MFASNGTEQLQHYWILRSRLDYMTSNNYRIRMTVHSLCLVLRLTATAASYPFHKRRRSGKLSIMISVSNVSNNAVIRNWLYRMVKHKWYKQDNCWSVLFVLDVSFIFLTDKKLSTVAAPSNTQNDCVYTPRSLPMKQISSDLGQLSVGLDRYQNLPIPPIPILKTFTGADTEYRYRYR